MENYYLIIIVILFALAISDLIVGVSNDAVNFLNSAIGAKVTSFKVIMIFAALGVLFGAAFSSGMMEVARNGIFHPQHFSFNEIMIIFLAVMLTDVILLDLFNTFGMPTSTTVSIVFELLGSALALATIKMATDPTSLSIAEYINSSKALAIISAILLSVAISFIAGAVIQFFVRLFFSFEFTERFRYFGSVFGGIAITAITYFMLIKGLKDSIFADMIVFGEPLKEMVKHRANEIIFLSFAGWTIILQILRWLLKIDILKIIVIIGTFALAMAFAGNDLVNFIGVPLAGYESFKQFIHQPEVAFLSPENFMMGGLAAKVKTPVYFLLIAGIIMVITLWMSKKARNVVKTSVDLSRQDEGDEKFGSSPIARSIIRQTIALNNTIVSILPKGINNFINKQFDQSQYNKRMKALGKEAPAFDTLRASVNLIVSAVLIAYATSNKLPLSTTYVTFMVAMGTSLSDRAWGRESAVFRITGVLLVVLGWFFTALVALTISFGVAYLLFYTGIFGIIIMLAILGFIIWKSTRNQSKKEKTEEASTHIIESVATKGVIESCKAEIVESLSHFSSMFKGIFNSLFVEDTREMRRYYKQIQDINKKSRKLKKEMYKSVENIQDDLPEAGHYYVEVLDYLREMAHTQEFAGKIMLDHLENKHINISFAQIEELRKLKDMLCHLTDDMKSIVEIGDYERLPEIEAYSAELSDYIASLSLNQVKRIKGQQDSKKASLLYLAIIHEAKNYNSQSLSMIRSQRDFVIHK